MASASTAGTQAFEEVYGEESLRATAVAEKEAPEEVDLDASLCNKTVTEGSSHEMADGVIDDSVASGSVTKQTASANSMSKPINLYASLRRDSAETG